jgi:hypothetical protein
MDMQPFHAVTSRWLEAKDTTITALIDAAREESADARIQTGLRSIRGKGRPQNDKDVAGWISARLCLSDDERSRFLQELFPDQQQSVSIGYTPREQVLRPDCSPSPYLMEQLWQQPGNSAVMLAIAMRRQNLSPDADGVATLAERCTKKGRAGLNRTGIAAGLQAWLDGVPPVELLVAPDSQSALLWQTLPRQLKLDAASETQWLRQIREDAVAICTYRDGRGKHKGPGWGPKAQEYERNPLDSSGSRERVQAVLSSDAVVSGAPVIAPPPAGVLRLAETPKPAAAQQPAAKPATTVTHVQPAPPAFVQRFQTMMREAHGVSDAISFRQWLDDRLQTDTPHHRHSLLMHTPQLWDGSAIRSPRLLDLIGHHLESGPLRSPAYEAAHALISLLEEAQTEIDQQIGSRRA